MILLFGENGDRQKII